LTKIIIKTVFIFFVFTIFLAAQQDVVSDTIRTVYETTFEMQKSPWGAVARSAVLPGWGQFYNEDFWHIPVIWGFLGWFGYQWYLNNKDYKENRDLFINTENTLYKSRRDFYRDQRDQFTIYFVITYLLNLVDAFVGAHLFDFSVEEDYLIKVQRLKFSYSF
jgi:hypothetical protein